MNRIAAFSASPSFFAAEDSDFCSSAASRLAKLHADGLADPAALPKGVLLESLASRAAAYAEGSRTWAVKAREVALLMAGQDSQVYASYAQES